jgi:U3 small nucleolar RNA-associated protein 10
MATLLQQQLATIAANSTHQLDLKAQKSRHSQSLLFEPLDAATQSFETIFQICIEAFDEICQLDSRFSPFGDNIFADSSKDVDRTQLNKRENEELDEVVAKFLGLVQARLLLKPAIKCMEWLVRRFRVHEYSTEALLLTFLPYHNADMFATVMSILPEQLPPTFRWLHPYVASLQYPPRGAILGALSTNNAFFSAFNTYVLRVAKAKHHSAIGLGFWASITAQAVNGMIESTQSGRDAIRKQREHDLLLRVLPILESALNIKDIPELYLGTCMIITILVVKTRLDDEALDALMQAVAASWTEQTMEEGVTCLAIIAEQKESIELPQVLVKGLLKFGSILQVLLELGHRHRVGNLAAGLAVGALRIGCKTGERPKIMICGELLHSGLFPQHKASVLESLVSKALNPGAKNDSLNMSISNAITNILIRATEQHPEVSALLETISKRQNIDLHDLGIPAHSSANNLETSDAMDLDGSRIAITQEEDTEQTFERLLASLPQLPAEVKSFLDPALPFEIFRDYLKVFRMSLSSVNRQERFMKLTSLEKSAGHGLTALLSLLARIWTSDALPASRLSAIKAAKAKIEATLGECIGLGMEYLLPYIVTALTDSSAKVRRAATDLCRMMQKAYNDRNSATAQTLISPGALYGSKHPAQLQLSEEDTQKSLTQSMVPILEDCVLDSSFATRALADILNIGALGAKDGSTARTKEIKKSLRANLCTFFSAHAVATPVMHVRLRLLTMLNQVRKSAVHARKEVLLPFVRQWAAKSVEAVQKLCEDEDVAPKDLDQAVLGSITHRSTDELQLLRDIASDSLGARSSLLPIAFNRLRHLFPHLKSSQTSLINFLVDLSLNDTSNDECQSLALETLRTLQLPTDIFVHIVESLPNATELQDQPPSAKKRRHSRGESDSARRVDNERIQSSIRRITLVLELLESCIIERHPELLRGLFHLLSELHHYKTMTGSELVYLYQMLLGCLWSIINGLNNATQSQQANIDASAIRTDLIVECVRTTKSTQVHNIALRLVSSLAAWAPELVLHSVMPLFTFMSSTVLRQVDEYSAHVADETVARIVPPLAASLKKKGKKVVTGAAELLLSFVAAYEHIPLHRRLGLFELLVKTLGEDDVLFAVLAMLIERYTDDKTMTGFAIELAGRFDATVMMKAVNQYHDLISDALQPKRHLSEVLLGFNEKSSDEATGSVEELLEGLSALLQAKTLRSKVATQLSRNDTDGSTRIRSLYATLLEKAMQLTQTVASTGALKDPSDTVLRSVLGLLPTSDFIQSSAQLMQSGSDATRQQVFRSLEIRAQKAERGDAAAQKIFIDVLPNCAVYIHDSQPVATRHAAIACIDQISEKFGKTDRGVVLAAAEQVAGKAALGSPNRDLRIISLLALASMVDVLRDEAIGMLPPVIQTTISYLEHCVQDEKIDQQLLDAGFSMLNALLETLPWMLSANSLYTAIMVADRAALSGKATAEPSTAHAFGSMVARKIVPADLFSAINRTWTDVLAYGPMAITQHLETLKGKSYLIRTLSLSCRTE